MQHHAILLCTHCVQTTYNVCSTYKYSSTYKYLAKYFKYLAKYLSVSTSTLGKSRKYLSKVQVLSNLYLSVLKYKYSCTWPHVWLLCIAKEALFEQTTFNNMGMLPDPHMTSMPVACFKLDRILENLPFGHKQTFWETQMKISVIFLKLIFCTFG